MYPLLAMVSAHAQPAAVDGSSDPERLQADTFEEIAGRASQDCHASMELMQADCVTGPCIAAYRINDPKSQMLAVSNLVGLQCPTWVEAFGESIKLRTGHADCGEWYWIAAPSGDWVENAYGLDTEALAEATSARMQAMVESWTCDPDWVPSLAPGWPKKVKRAFQPSVFTQLALQLPEACGRELAFVRTECTEPPCIAVYRLSENEDAFGSAMSILGDCKLWRKAHGGGAITAGHPTACGESFFAIAPKLKGISHDAIQTRINAIAESWTCKTSEPTRR